MIECRCCTCEYRQNSGWYGDPACRKHGQHGQRGCWMHSAPAKDCTCGCKYFVTQDNITDREIRELLGGNK